MNWNKFKLYLIDVFDLEEDTNKASLITNRIIYILIFLSTIGVILETTEISQAYLSYIEAFESVVMFIFLIEFLMRILITKELFKKHKTFGERSVLIFYYIIDFASVVPPIVLLFGAHHHFDYFMSIRLLRLFKAFRQDHSVEFIIRAIIKKKKELFKSAVLTFIFTMFLSVMLYEAENDFVNTDETVSHAAQSNFKNIMTTILWSFSVFVDEVSGFGDFRPITPFGQVIGGLIGFMKIAIVVIPTGIIATGFLEVIADDELKEKRKLLLQAFRQHKNKSLGISLYEPPHSLSELQNSLNIYEQDIYRLATDRKYFRIRATEENNLIEFYAYGYEFWDNELQIDLQEKCVFRGTEYGIKRTDVKSSVLLVCPDSLEFQSIGYLSYCLAEMLNADWVSNEKFSKHSLNAQYEFDFDKNGLFTREKPTFSSPIQEKRWYKKLPLHERAFENFLSDISQSSANSNKKIVLVQAKDLSQPFLIQEAKQCNYTDLTKWLLLLNPQTMVLQFDKKILTKPLDFELLKEIRKQLDS
jgi:voltage-gated potassium channel